MMVAKARIQLGNSGIHGLKTVAINSLQLSGFQNLIFGFWLNPGPHGELRNPRLENRGNY